MAKPEGETTRLLRSTMDLDLDAVNAKLTDAGEKPLDAGALAKRRSWIRAKDSKHKTKRTGPKPPLRKPAAAKAKKRRSPPPVTEPREGTFAAFVWSQPYDMDVKELLKRAKAAGMSGQPTQIYKVRAKYPKPETTTTAATKLNQIATPAALRGQAARVSQAKVQPTSKVLSVAPRDKNLSSARSQFVLLLMRLGLDDAEVLMQDYRLAHDRLEASISEGKF